MTVSGVSKIFCMGAFLVAQASSAKLPAPVLDDAAKAKAAEAAAKTAWSGKVEGFLLCKWMDKAAAHYQKTAAAGGKTIAPAVATIPNSTCHFFIKTPLIPNKLFFNTTK